MKGICPIMITNRITPSENISLLVWAIQFFMRLSGGRYCRVPTRFIICLYRREPTPKSPSLTVKSESRNTFSVLRSLWASPIECKCYTANKRFRKQNRPVYSLNPTLTTSNNSPFSAYQSTRQSIQNTLPFLFLNYKSQQKPKHLITL